jgi:hypothetical protein
MGQPAPAPTPLLRAVGFTATAWCLGFAAVSAWQVVAGPPAGRWLAADASGLAILSMLVGVLKLAGAAVALAAVLAPPGLPRRPPQLLGVALWGVFGLLAATTWAGSRRSPGWPARPCCSGCSWGWPPPSLAGGACCPPDPGGRGGVRGRERVGDLARGAR